MINFHLQFPIPEFKSKINYKQKIVFIGSCFAENIGSLFKEYKLDALVNTHGIQYNPFSVANALTKCISKQLVNDHELFFANELWNSWEHHSRFSKSKKEDAVYEMNDYINKGYEYLKTADWLIITLGSSFAYKHIENNRFVSNCHKIPQKEFSKYCFSTLEAVTHLENVIRQLLGKNKNLKVVFTVSPVRYVRDGVVENNLSKARLIDAVHTLVSQFQNCFYFPSYELIIDDLRDYRFFENDLVHPNQQAIHYVFNKFVETTFDLESKNIIEKIKEIITAKNHRPADRNINSYQSFKHMFLNKSLILKKEYPYLNLEEEIRFFENKSILTQ